MPNWWESEPRDVRSRREGRAFRASAERIAFRRQARGEMARRGLDPNLFPQLGSPEGPLMTRIQADEIQPDTKSKGGGGGILGKIASPVLGAVDDVSSAVFRGKVREPWDVLRPVKQLMDLSYREVGRPLGEKYADIGAGGGLLGKSGIPGVSDVFRKRPIPISPELEHEIAAEATAYTVFDPLNYPGLILGGTGAVGKIGARTAARLPVLDALFSGIGSRAALKNILPAISGGAAESPEMERIIQGMRGTTLDKFGVHTAEEVIIDARQNLSLTQFGRRVIGNSLPGSVTRWLEGRGVRLIDDDMGMLLHEYGRIRAFGHNAAARSNDLIRAAVSKTFRLNNEGRVLDLPGQPYIDDVIETYKDFKLNPQQIGAVKLVNEQLSILRQTEKAAGLKVHDIPTPRGIYTHRQVIRRPVNITDPKSLTQLEETVPVGPVVKEKLGAKQAFEKPRSVSTKAEGIEAGLEYMGFADAQQARIVQGYNRVADKWLEAALRPYGFSVTELLGQQAPDLLKQGVALVQRIRRLQSLEREATIAKRVGSRWAFRMPGKLVENDLVALGKRAKEASGLPLKAGRQATLAGIQEEARGLLRTARAELQPIKARRATIMRELTAGGTREFPKRFRGKFYSEQVGERLLDFDSPKASGLLESTVNRFNNLIRPLMATADASFMGVQGLIGAAHNPKAYIQSLRYAFTTAYDERIAAHQASGLLDNFLKSGGHFAARNDMGEFLFSGWPEKLPGFGKAARLSNTWFTRFGNSLRLEMFESAAKAGASTKDLEGLARMVNLATGYTGGKATSLETAMLFAPRFFRSQIGLVSDGLTKRTLGGNEAAKAISKLVILGTALTYSLNEVLGNKTDFNPSSSNFLRIRALGRDISVFGPWDSLVKAIYIGATNPIQGTSYIARTKASPAVARIYDLIQGHTIQGADLKWGNAEEVLVSLGQLTKQLGPISLQQAGEEGIPKTPQEIGASALQILGTKAAPLTAYENLANRRNEAAQESFQKNWPDLEPRQKFELERARPELKRPEATSEYGKALEARTTLLDTYETQMKALDSAGMAGPEWRAEYQRINAARAGAFDQWERDHPEAAGRLQVPDNPNDLALQQQRDAFINARTPWGNIDPEKLAVSLNDLEDSWTPEQKRYVEDNTGLRDTPLTKEYKKAIRTLRPYFELEDSVWDTIRKGSPELSPYETTDDYVFSIVQGLVKQGYPLEQAASIASDLPVLRQVESIVSDLKERYRFANPEADAALAKWFGATPIFMQGRHKRRSR